MTTATAEPSAGKVTSAEPFDFNRLDVEIPCDVDTCDGVAEWILTWAMTPLPCGRCVGAPLVCAQHFNLTSKQLASNALLACQCPQWIGRIRSLVIRVQPL